jgi:predicted membrane protein
MHKDKSVSESSIALQIIIGLIIVILIYKFIDTKIIKWPLIIMTAGAFFYSISDDFRELKMNYLKHHLDTGEVPTLKDGIRNWLKAIFFLIIFIITLLFVFPNLADKYIFCRGLDEGKPSVASGCYDK